MRRRPYLLTLPSGTLRLGERTLLMAILNVTPDSFSDRGLYFDRKAAIAHGLELGREGADILDIGGESTRPGAQPVPAEEELDRTIPVIEGLRRNGLRIPISIDTYKAAVAERAVRAGAEIINDISGLRFDPRLASVASQTKAGLVLMHTRGTPETMQKLPPVAHISRAVRSGLLASVRRAQAAGVSRKRIIVDPGIGFGKTAAQNFELLTAGLLRLAKLGYPVLAGPSRKFFIRQATQPASRERESARARPGAQPGVPEAVVFGTAAAVTAAILHGAHIVRVHDVRQMLPVARLADHLVR